MRIFVSHAHADSDLAEAIIDLITKALNIPHEEIRCTSVDGYRLPAGASISSQLRQEVVDADLAVSILTPTSLASSYVLFELGARWGANKAMIPLISKGLTARRVPVPISELNLVEIKDPAQAFHLLESVSKLLGLIIARPSILQSAIAKVTQFSDQEVPPQLSIVQSPTAAIANLSKAEIELRKSILAAFSTDEQLSVVEIASFTGATSGFIRFYMDEMVGEGLAQGLGTNIVGNESYKITHEGRRFWLRGPKLPAAVKS